MQKLLITTIVLVAAIALVVQPAGAHQKGFGSELVRVVSETGQFYEGGEPVGNYTTVQGYVRSENKRCINNRMVKVTLVDSETGDRFRLPKSPTVDGGKFGADRFRYTARYDKAVVTLLRRVVSKTAGHRHVCKGTRVTVPHKDLG